MKKIKMFAAAAMFCAATFAGYTAYDNATMTDQERFMLANIEALANDETSASCTFNKVEKNQEKNTLNCSGKGSLCCVMN